jgi:signal transduction histidine kinase
MELMRNSALIIIFIILLSCSEDNDIDIGRKELLNNYAIKARVDSLNSISNRYVRAFPDSGIDVGKQALLLAEKINYKDGMALALKLIGSNNWSKGYFDTGLEYFYKSLELYEELDDLDGLSRVLNNIGLIFLTSNEHDKSIGYFERSIEISKKIDSKIMLGNAYFNLGIVYNSKKDFGKSIEQIEYSIPLLIESGNVYALSQALSYQGDNYINVKKYDKAIKYLDRAWASIDTVNDIRSKSIILNHYSNYYLKVKNPQKAIKYAKAAYKITLELDLKYDQWVATEYLSKAFAGLRDYDSAYHYKVINSVLYDSLRKEEKLRKKNELEMEYEFSKKTKQMEIEQHKKELDLENKIYRGQLFIYFITAAFVLLLIVAFIIYRDYKQKTRMNDLLTEKNDLITKQKEVLEELNNELDESNSTKDKFFSIIAHDLRNPISAFKQVTDLMSESFDEFDEEEQKEFINLMKKSSDSVYQLLENLLTWSRSQRGIIEYKPDEFDLSDLVKMILDLQYNQASRKNIELLNSMPESIKIVADSNMINTVIRNLVSNAIKFTNPGSKIEVGGSVIPEGIEIFVKDNGVGMDKKTADKLFRIDQTFTTEGTNQEAGTGLGLILCKEFIDKHNGNIRVESTPGKGSTFTITIPTSS